MSDFPSNADPIHAVSLGIAAGGAGLLMTIWLMMKVRRHVVDIIQLAMT